MDLKIKKSTLKQGIALWVVLWMVLFSKTVYFGIINKSTYQWLFYTSSVLGALLYGVSLKKVQRPFIRVIPFLVLFICNAFFYMGDMTSKSLNELIGVALNFFITAVICGYLDIERFAKYYIDVIFVLCIISLPCFIIANINENLALSFCQPDYDWNTNYGYSFFYTWGWWGTIKNRNSGPFWEPGAFQGFIILAVLMMLYEVDGGLINEKRKKWLLIIFIITTITTGSTTGYILLVLVMITQWNRIKLMFNEIPKNLRYVTSIAIALAVVIIVVQSGNIGEKFRGESSSSAFIRMSDFVNGLAMWTQNPFLGLGLTSKRQMLRNVLGVNINDSVGLSFMAYTYGIPFLIYYLYCLKKGIKVFFKAAGWQSMVIFLIFMILHLTEGLWWLPVYLYIVFSYSGISAVRYNGL